MRTIGIVLVITAWMLTGCAAHTAGTPEAAPSPTGAETAEDAGAKDAMRLWIGETEVPVIWEENASVDELRALCPLTIRMSMYGGFEQVGPIGRSIARDDEQTSADCGDIVLYSGDQIVIFFGSNSWAYTRLGRVDLPQRELCDLLGSRDVSITLG